MKCLFIGGPVDGRRLDVDDGIKYWRIPGKYNPKLHFADDPIKIYTYQKEILVSRQNLEYIVYVWMDEGEIDVVNALINSYRR